MSVTSKAAGSSLFPAPIELMIGVWLASACSTSDCVDHVVILGKIKFLRGIRHVECLVGVDNRMRVDGFDAFLSDIDLVLSDGGGGCDDLTVDVG